jgi:hypothetical protein
MNFQDVTGRLIFIKEEELAEGNNNCIINLTSLSKGVYFLHFESEDRNYVRKIVVE